MFKSSVEIMVASAAMLSWMLPFGKQMVYIVVGNPLNDAMMNCLCMHILLSVCNKMLLAKLHYETCIYKALENASM